MRTALSGKGFSIISLPSLCKVSAMSAPLTSETDGKMHRKPAIPGRMLASAETKLYAVIHQRSGV